MTPPPATPPNQPEADPPLAEADTGPSGRAPGGGVTISSSYGRVRPSGGLELQSWCFMRISGLILLFLALGHLVLMHLIHNVDEINYAFVAGRYAGWFWRGYDLLMLLLAMIHGTNGARILIDDYLHRPIWRRVALTSLYLVCGGLTVLGTVAALFFKPVPL